MPVDPDELKAMGKTNDAVLFGGRIFTNSRRTAELSYYTFFFFIFLIFLI